LNENNIDVLDTVLYFPTELTNSQQEITYREMLLYRDKSTSWEMGNNPDFKGCYIPIKTINSKEVMLSQIKEKCTTLTELIQ
jgi:hypothetical protein